MTWTHLRPAFAVVAALGMTAGAGCGDDEDQASGGQRYCELTQELEEIGEQVFSDLPDDPTEADFTAANSRFVDAAEDELDELVEAAPSEIEEDVEAYAEHFRAQARGEDADVSDERLVEWEEENCSQ